MKRILTIILFCAGFVLNGQTITGDKVIARTQLELATYKVTGISNDSGMTANSIMTLPTQYAVRNYVQNYVNSHAASAAGSSGQVQYNNAGSFGALDSFTVSANPDRLGIGVPTPTARLDIQGSGATSATNALRVRNSSGTETFKVDNSGHITIPNAQWQFFGVNQGLYNDGNIIYLRGASSSIVIQSPNQVNNLTFTNISTTQTGAQFIQATNTTASTPSMLLSGTGYSGGNATTTKPTFLIEPTGATSTGWSTSGTKLGVNAESGFTGNLIDAQVNGTSVFNLSPTGVMGIVTVNASAGVTALGGFNTNVGGNGYRFSSGGYFICSSNGVFKFSNSTDNDFNRLQLGGTTSSFPALKRNGTGIDIRLADDSGYGALTSGDMDINGSGSTSATNALRVRNSSGTNLFTVRNDNAISFSSATSAVDKIRFGTYVEIANTLPRINIYQGGNGVGLDVYNGDNTNQLFRFNNTSGGGLGNISYMPFTITSNTTASTPSMLLSGTGFSGGTSTTTKPTLLIEPTGTTSTGWSTSGTKLGVNAESGFTGYLMDLQVNGATKFRVDKDGKINATDMTGQHYSGATVTLGGWWTSSGLNSTDGIYFGSSHQLYWGNSTINTTGLKDVAIGRGSAGVLEVNNGTAGTYGAIQSLYDRFGSGSPESVVTAPVGAVYHRTDGGAGTSFYVKESGTGNTGWISK